MLLHSYDIVRFLTSHRFPLSDEKVAQALMAQELADAGADVRREVALGDGDIIDMMVGGIGIEVKIKGQKRAIYRQCERYCMHERVRELVLATSVATGFPQYINGKPVYVANLARAWL